MSEKKKRGISKGELAGLATSAGIGGVVSGPKKYLEQAFVDWAPKKSKWMTKARARGIGGAALNTLAGLGYGTAGLITARAAAEAAKKHSKKAETMNKQDIMNYLITLGLEKKAMGAGLGAGAVPAMRAPGWKSNKKKKKK